MSDNFQNAFKEGRNLTQESRKFTATLFRDELVNKIIQTISRKRSVLLVGPNGVGKTKVVQEFARQLRRSGRMKVFEFSTAQLLSGTKYLGEWESKVTAILESAAKAKCVLYFSDVWNLATAGISSGSKTNAWDVMRPYVEQNKIIVLGEITARQLRDMTRHSGFVNAFEPIEVPMLPKEAVFEIVNSEARRLKLDADEPTVDRVMELCQQFLPTAQGPGLALELLGQVSDYQIQKSDNDEEEGLSPQFVEKVFSIYSGLPLLVVSPSVTKPVSEVKAWFEDRIIGQKAPINSVVETIALYKAGLHDPNRPIGSFLFVGPTGVGKTELARALAKYLFGNENRLLRFDLSEYKDYHSFQLLIGDPNRPSQGARLIDPVRAKPFQVILFDEIEKAHANVWDLLLQLLDEGHLTPATGKSVNFRNTIVVATSNVGARERAQASVGFVADGVDAGADRMKKALEHQFRPEFLNRFQYVEYFHPLSKADVREIAGMELQRILSRHGIASRQIKVDITEPVLDLIVSEGYDESYGARALRRMVQRFVTMPIATLLLQKQVEQGVILRLNVQHNNVVVTVIDTPESKANKAQARPLKLATTATIEKITSRADLQAFIERLKEARLSLEKKIAEKPSVVDEQTDRDSPYQWDTSAEEAQFYRRREVERLQQHRLNALLQREVELKEWLGSAVTRVEQQRLVDAAVQHGANIEAARCEFAVMPDNAFADALVEIAPLGASIKQLADMVNMYTQWALRCGYEVEMVCEPLEENQAAILAISGNFPYGYLHMEEGHHRFRNALGTSVLRVRVLRWVDDKEHVKYSDQRALKKDGLLGGRVRSRLKVEDSNLLIQNERTLNDNRTFAASIVASYRANEEPEYEIVRRYDSEPFLVKDYLTGIGTGKADILSAQGFHQLLSERILANYDE